MRLTNYMRDAFVNAAMHDVPKINYNEQAEKLAREYLHKKFESIFPGIDPNGVANNWLEKCSVSLPGSLQNIYAIAPSYRVLETDLKIWPKLQEIATKHNIQDKERVELRSKLRGVANSCTTRKALAEALPEFEKYLPEDEAKAIRSLPVVANVLSDFVKAGWPKGNKGKIAAAKAAA
jgi:hypothetical protein